MLGVAWEEGASCTAVTPAPRDGVPSSLSTMRSNRPRTRPSLCGVGPMDRGAAGLKRVLAMEGVVVDMGLWGDERGLDGVSRCFCILDGVWVLNSAGLRFFGWPGFEGGGTLPDKMSRSLLYCLYLRAGLVPVSCEARRRKEGECHNAPMSGLRLMSSRPGFCPWSLAQADSQLLSSARSSRDCDSKATFCWSSIAES